MENATPLDGYARDDRVRSSGRTMGVLVRVALVVGVHFAILLVLMHLAPEVRKRVEPVFVSLITPPVSIESAAPAPPPPKVATKLVPTIPQPSKIEPTPAPTAGESPAAITAPVSPPTAASLMENPGASTAAPVVVIPKLPAAIVPPRFDAAYLNNPRPEYPRAARRMGEHGKVMLRVYVAASGSAEKVEVRTSSGSPRLDQAAREAVERWKFTPARQGDEPVAAWVLVPITFVLEG